MIIQDQLLIENAVTDSRTEFINYELVIIITIQDNTIHFEMLSLLQTLFITLSIYLLDFLDFLGPLTNAHSTAICCPKMSFWSNSSLAARASLYVSYSTRAYPFRKPVLLSKFKWMFWKTNNQIQLPGKPQIFICF